MYLFVNIRFITIAQTGQHADYVENACIMFDVDTEHYLDAFDCPMRFDVHDITLSEVLLHKNPVAALLLGTDKDFYFRSQTVPKLYIHYFSYTGLYIYVQLAYSPAIYTLPTKNTFLEKTRKCYISDKRESIDVELLS